MDLSSKEMLGRLGAGESIDSVCRAARISRSRFDAWWKDETTSRLGDEPQEVAAAVRANVDIERDQFGIPHIDAAGDHDLWFGFGYAMAQDRLFQLDFLRRKAAGRLSEILGPDGLDRDTIARTVGLPQIAERLWDRLPDETRRLIEAFSDGVNAVIARCGDRLPVEFDLLDYRPQPWRAVDCLAIEVEFSWYLTGRLHVIAIPELVKRTLGAGPLYEAVLTGEADEECILPPGSYPNAEAGSQPVGVTTGDPDEGAGSNNWVVAGSRSVTGRPLVASDPHIAFEAVSCWYQVHLSSDSINVAGMAYMGVPCVMFGRNEHVGWGCTNNICSLRDLYQEKTDPDHPGCFLYDGQWQPATEREEVIHVKGQSPVKKTIRSSRNGPIVDEILPPPARHTGPVSLRWLGADQGGCMPALVAMNRAGSVEQFRQGARDWHVPTWCMVFADTDGHIGCQCTGRIPIRRIWERGYRPGWDPEHQWDGLIPFEGMPSLTDPERGWIASANNRAAADDFPYPLSGTWTSGHRARRVRQMIEQREKLSVDDFQAMHQDTVSLRAKECAGPLLNVLASSTSPAVNQAAAYLDSWDYRMEPDRVAASIFDVFFARWSAAVSSERFEGEVAEVVSTVVGGLASRLLTEDEIGWFTRHARKAAILAAFDKALETLTDRLGPDMSEWTWGRLHRMSLRHVLSDRGDLSTLLDQDRPPVRGDFLTVCNTGNDADFNATTGAGYRQIADMSTSPPVLSAIDAQSQSGRPGDPHYDDQLQHWIGGGYHDVPLTRSAGTGRKLTLKPAGGG